MRGWERVGQVAGFVHDEVALCSDGHGVRPGDIIAFTPSYDGAALRPGFLRVAEVGYDWVTTTEWPQIAVPLCTDTDYVYRATALGENAFKRGGE